MDAATEAIRRRAIRAAGATIYLAEYEIARAKGMTDEEARQRAWSARERARAALLAAQS